MDFGGFGYSDGVWGCTGRGRLPCLEEKVGDEDEGKAEVEAGIRRRASSGS